MVERRHNLKAAAFVSLALFVSVFVIGMPAPVASAASAPVLIILTPVNN